MKINELDKDETFTKFKEGRLKDLILIFHRSTFDNIYCPKNS